MKFYYFYKITNLINKKYYFGVHSTSNLDDGYMGSGIALKRAYKKYGINNFIKQILYYFNDEKQMYAFEENYINQNYVNDSQCYNLIIGGRSKKTLKKLNELSLLTDRKQHAQKIKEGIYKYWNTGDVSAKKIKQSQANKKYWTTGDVELKRKKHSIAIKKSYQTNPVRREKIIKKLYERWNGENGELNKKKLSESLKNSKKKKQANKKIKESKKFALYNNPDFIARWKKIYEENMDLICELLKHSNLPDKFIISNLFNKNVHISRIIAYYIHLGMLPKEYFIQNKKRFLRFNNNNNKGHKDGGSKKTIFSSDIKYDFHFLYEDFFKQWKILIDFMQNDKISDSMITNKEENQKKLPNYYQIIEYFQELNIISDVHTIFIRTDKIVGDKKFTVPAKKTKFTVNYNNVSKYLIDKEFNLYGIDDNGNPFCKGKFELELNGKKCSLRCV